MSCSRKVEKTTSQLIFGQESSCRYNKDYKTCNLKEIHIGKRTLSNYPHAIPSTCTSYEPYDVI